MKKLKAQQITEFLIAAPLLLIFFVILTEFAFALNANLTLVNATKNSVSSYYSAYVKGTLPKGEISAHIKASLTSAKLPNIGTLNVDLLIVDSSPVILSTYTYKPDFNLLFLPALKEMHFSSVAVLPCGVLDVSGYSSGLTDGNLSNIYADSNPLPGGEEGEI